MTLELIETTFSYGEDFTLKPLSYEFKKGSFSVLMGPNGSGKSTLFALLNGLLKPDCGRVLLNGRDVHSFSPRERARILGLVPQINERPFAYSVESMLKMGRYPHQGFWGSESLEDKLIVGQVMERLDLVSLGRRSVKELSGGEYQRVLLGRVLVQQPSVLLLDEPANHLDLKHQTNLLSLLKEEAQAGTTVITVLHDINQALFYGDQGLLLQAGKCIKRGMPGEILTPELLNDVFQVKLTQYWDLDGDNFLLGPNTGKK